MLLRWWTLDQRDGGSVRLTGPVDPDHLNEFEEFLSRRIDEWETRRPERWGDLGGRRDDPMLMRIAGTCATTDDPDSWETPTSMRNVDVECSAEVVARYNAAGEVKR